jgi:PIN domain nuclease of toxin-antitoxin system
VRLLLDTHALIWWLLGDPALSLDAKACIANNGNIVFVSAASGWEISTKYRIGKLPNAAPFAADVHGAAASQGFDELPISLRHAQLAGELPGGHRDPFDRMLVAQAILVDLTLISNEVVFDRWAIRRLW